MTTFDGIVTAQQAEIDLEIEDEGEAIDVELVVFDMAGTTVKDDGLVEKAFALAADRTGLTDTAEKRAEALDYVRDTMGQSKIEVFRALTGDEDAAVRANEAFEQAYSELVATVGVEAIPGAEEVMRELRGMGVKVALVTGFSRATQCAILDALGWQEIADVTLSPAEAGRGRPFPDLPLAALLRTGATSVRSMVVVGDTASDMLSGVNAGAGLVVGVLSGAHDEDALEDAGADAVITSIADLPALLGLR
ncbi:phosphonatase-like hydrolase [Glaciibacter psychrotolerans]|uniref:Phosphonatase-like hydrolase n=1 Tax=Glaciibacter psychrotolerans TaxID=670054 RepID=A0A7Z0EI49_9MICO|nr:phosphonatase-like hydrolase [Leifsonia psychrotolerans]NYJ21284.1 phosphonatase-like hydrolase [Leifsonia psychrotolerans]